MKVTRVPKKLERACEATRRSGLAKTHKSLEDLRRALRSWKYGTEENPGGRKEHLLRQIREIRRACESDKSEIGGSIRRARLGATKETGEACPQRDGSGSAALADLIAGNRQVRITIAIEDSNRAVPMAGMAHGRDGDWKDNFAVFYFAGGVAFAAKVAWDVLGKAHTIHDPVKSILGSAIVGAVCVVLRCIGKSAISCLTGGMSLKKFNKMLGRTASIVNAAIDDLEKQAKGEGEVTIR